MLNEKYRGKLGFATWANRNMIVLAQIESTQAHANLDGILSVPGLTGITGGHTTWRRPSGTPVSRTTRNASA